MESLIRPYKDGRIAGLKEFLVLKPFFETLGIDAIDSCRGQIVCPGEELHTTPNKSSDCIVWINSFKGLQIPRLSCFHNSCHEMVELVNDFIFRAIVGLGSKSLSLAVPTSAGCGLKKHASVKTSAMPSWTAALSVIAKYPWTYSDIVNSSPDEITEPPEVHHIYLINLFAENDVIWVGRDVMDTGKGHEWRFRTAEKWALTGKCKGNYTCPSTFIPGVCSRSSANVAERKFLVVESDHLNRDQVGSVFMMLQREYGLVLRAVVDTAGKSLHGWFNMPPEAQLSQLKSLLTTLMCDPKMFGASQPCRLPGARRGGKYQTLIYFNENP